MDPETVFTFLTGPDSDKMLYFMTAQISARYGLKHFRHARVDAIMTELKQLVYHKVMEGQRASQLTREQKQAALKHICFSNQK